MKGWIEVKVWTENNSPDSASKVSLPVSSIAQVGSMGNHGYVIRPDGGTLETHETYQELLIDIALR